MILNPGAIGIVLKCRSTANHKDEDAISDTKSDDYCVALVYTVFLWTWLEGGYKVAAFCL